ncbi:hypothetical protein HAX54_013793 [Datura stramonium]|uniref:NB-ARC domain-containing protein n=1 Tax=Datura stramonium TaxID=4076 RepID=A0ABS8TLX1_DATST|nr:hypothetical protein [Datura stramonium]
MENFEKTTADAKVSTRCSFSLDNEEFVGFKEEIEQIIQRLTGGTKEAGCYLVVGMRRTRQKATLAKVYNNRSIATNHFDVGAFCTISQRYSIRKLLAEILKQVTGEKRDIKEDEDVADLRGALFCKRYLIVLDDIWNYEAWEELQFSFPSMEVELW